jgi:hypothetical protein
MVMASRVIHAMQLRAGSDKSTVRTPLGDFRFEKAKEVGPSLPVYPQATLVLPGGDAPHPLINDDETQVVSSTYYANSSREFVVNWYVEHLSPEFVRQDNGPKKLPDVFHNAHISDDDIIFVGERGDQVRVVALSTDDAGTKITLLRATSPSSTPIPNSSPAPTQ